MILEDKLYKIIGERLAAKRNGLMTQDALAEAVEVERTSITNIEAGRQKPPLSLLFRICDVLNIEPVSVLPSIKEISSTHSLSVGMDGSKEDIHIAINESKPDISDDTSKKIEDLYNKI